MTDPNRSSIFKPPPVASIFVKAAQAAAASASAANASKKRVDRSPTKNPEVATPTQPSKMIKLNTTTKAPSTSKDNDADEVISSSQRTSSSSSTRQPSTSASSSTTSAAASAAQPKKITKPSPDARPAKSSTPSSRKKKGDEAQAAAAALAAKISPDVDVVMKKVMDLRTKEVARYATTKKVTLAELNIPNVKQEVLSLDANEVRATIERVMIQCVQSIIGGHGFSFSIPVRSAANQLYVPELDRIVLKDKVGERIFASVKNSHVSAITTRILSLIYELCLKRIHVTKRDLFYTDVKLFQEQDNTDHCLEDVACMLGCTRTSLNVVASEKGIVVGRISFKDDGDLIDCTKMGIGGKAIPPSIDRVTDITGDAKFVLLVEKDAAFMRLAEDRFYQQYPCCIITAKGQPDVATRLFLKKVKETLRIPVLGLFDADPYGLKILSVYMSGSKNMSYDSASLTTPDIKWLGVRPSDLNAYKIPAQCRLPMTEHDIATGKQLLEEEFIQKNPEWIKELELMLRTKEKAEIQALSNFGFQYLSKVYLPLKIQAADWI